MHLIRYLPHHQTDRVETTENKWLQLPGRQSIFSSMEYISRLLGPTVQCKELTTRLWETARLPNFYSLFSVSVCSLCFLLTKPFHSFSTWKLKVTFLYEINMLAVNSHWKCLSPVSNVYWVLRNVDSYQTTLGRENVISCQTVLAYTTTRGESSRLAWNQSFFFLVAVTMDITSNDSRTPPGGNGVAPKLKLIPN